MTWNEQLLMAIRNVLRAGSKTLLCVLAVCIGIGSVGLTSSLGSSAGSAVNAELRQIGIRGYVFYEKSGDAFSEEAMQVFAQQEGVQSYMPLILSTAGIRLRDQTATAGVLGIDEHLGQVFDLELLHGALPVRGQILENARIAVIDSELAQKAYKRTNVVGKTLLVQLNGATQKLKICAVIQSQAAGVSALFGGSIPHLIYLPYTTLSDFSSQLKTDKVIVSLEENAASISQQLLERLAQVTGRKYRAENLNQYLSSLSNISSILTLLISSIASISLIVGGLGVMNTMIASVETRTREIGIYRALGARQRDIVGIFLLEALVLCVIGGILGILLDGLLLFAINRIVGVHISLQAKSMLSGLALAVSCGLLFGWLPALRAAKLDPICAIRSE